MAVQMISITDHILRTAVQTDIDAANVFAADSQHDHDHTANKQIHSHQRTVARKDAGRVQNLFNDDDQTKNKTDYRAKSTGKGSDPQRLNGKCSKPIGKQRDQLSQCIGGMPA